MKSTVADYQTRIFAVRIEAVNGTIVRFVQYPHDLTMASNTSPIATIGYKALSGYEFTNLSMTASMTPPVIDFRGIVSDAVGQLDRTEVAARIWDGARAYLFATTWNSPIEDEEKLGQFLLGKYRLEDDQYIFELMGLIDAVNQSTGRTISPLCPWTLFDETLDGVIIPWTRSRCTGPRSAPDGPALADYKVTGTITGVTSQTVFTDSSRAEAADYFGAGAIKFTSGNNTGLLSEEIKDYNANGTITLFQQFPNTIQIGDNYEMIPGCRKSRDICKSVKFGNNAINFGGFDRVPTQSVYSKFGTGNA